MKYQSLISCENIPHNMDMLYKFYTSFIFFNRNFLNVSKFRNGIRADNV